MTAQELEKEEIGILFTLIFLGCFLFCEGERMIAMIFVAVMTKVILLRFMYVLLNGRKLKDFFNNVLQKAP